jgi:alanyl-tRNA synthetase
VPATGQIGLFKIVSEGAVAAGVRRVEAITAGAAENYYRSAVATLDALRETLKQPKDVLEKVNALLEENAALRSRIESMLAEKARMLKGELIAKAQVVGGVRLIAEVVDLPSADAIKDLSFDLRNQFNDLVFLAAANIDGKPYLSLIISDDLVSGRSLNATTMIRELAKEVQGGGGGQPFYATAGGKNTSGLSAAIAKLSGLIG